MEFRKMRRSKQQLSEAEAIAILESGTSGVLALSGDNDYPYAVPLSYAYSDGKLIFHCAKEGHKLDAVKSNAKASFCVISKDDVVPEKYTTCFESVIAFGKIRIAEDESELKNFLMILADKYRPGFMSEHEKTIQDAYPRTNILVMEIEHLTGKQAIELLRQHRTIQG